MLGLKRCNEELTSLVNEIYSRNSKQVPTTFEELMKDTESREFALYVFSEVLTHTGIMEK